MSFDSRPSRAWLVRILVLSLLGIGFSAFPCVRDAHSAEAAPDTVNAMTQIETKTMTAWRASSGAPVVDGKLDDPCWQSARVYSDFIQEDPVEGAKPTEHTEVRVVYDNKALYIAVRALDSEPDKIIAQLRRKDDVLGLAQDDFIMIMIDSYHDLQNGYEFIVNPKGSNADCSLYEDAKADLNWEGTWRVAASIDADGWNAELCIPFASFRFPNAQSLVWGFNVCRYIARKKEVVAWQFKPKAVAGLVSRLGHLELGHVRSHPEFELYPYVAGQSTFEPRNPLANPDGRSTSSRIGLDVRYNVRSDVVLNGALNPDFGQVEADPAVLNLSAYETFYPEKRPFFLEGTGVFDTPIQLFYTRRIGRKPRGLDISAVDEVLTFPEFTTILFAGKLTGKTAGGAGVGFIEAVTREELASVDSMGVRRERIVEPLSNCAVARFTQDFAQGNSMVGGMITAVNARRLQPAYTGGVDWSLKFRKNEYAFRGQLAGSRAEGQKTGYGTKIDVGKEGGKYFRARLSFDALSPEFEVNDLGFLKRNDLISVRPWVQLRHIEDPWWVIRSVTGEATGDHTWNYAGDNLTEMARFSTTLTFLNYYYLQASVFHALSSFDDRSTRGGPLLENPASTGTTWLVMTDTRRKIYASSILSLSSCVSGSRSWYYGSTLYFKSSNLTFSLSGGYSYSYDDAQWLMNLDDNADGSYDHIIFGELESRTLDLSARADMAFSPNLSLQVYVQPFISAGDYLRFKELAAPASYEFRPYDLGFEPDYNVKALRSNVVLRWEFRPRSILFLAWSRDSSDDSNPGDFSPGRDLESLLGAPSRNIFLGKVSYRFSL